MSNDLITRAKELSAKATDEPWYNRDGDVMAGLDTSIDVVAPSVWNVDDRRFIIQARSLLPRIADLAEQKTADLADANASIIKLRAEANEQRALAEVLARGIAAYRTGGYTAAQLWENEEGKTVPR